MQTALLILASFFAYDRDKFYERAYQKAPHMAEEYDYIIVYYQGDNIDIQFYRMLQGGAFKCVATKGYYPSYQNKWYQKVNINYSDGGCIVEFFDTNELVHRKCRVKSDGVDIYFLGKTGRKIPTDWRFLSGFKNPPEELMLKQEFEEDEF